MARTIARLVRIDLNRDSDRALVLFLSADLALIFLNLLHEFTGSFADPNYSIQLERGFGETFQYLKEGWITLILVILAVRAGNGLYTCWVAVFAFLLVDDLFAAHSRAGEVLGQALQLTPVLGLRARDMGEFIAIRRALRRHPHHAAVESVVGGCPGHHRGRWRDDRHEPDLQACLPGVARIQKASRRASYCNTRPGAGALTRAGSVSQPMRPVGNDRVRPAEKPHLQPQHAPSLNRVAIIVAPGRSHVVQ